MENAHTDTIDLKPISLINFFYKDLLEDYILENTCISYTSTQSKFVVCDNLIFVPTTFLNELEEKHQSKKGEDIKVLEEKLKELTEKALQKEEDSSIFFVDKETLIQKGKELIGRNVMKSFSSQDWDDLAEQYKKYQHKVSFTFPSIDSKLETEDEVVQYVNSVVPSLVQEFNRNSFQTDLMELTLWRHFRTFLLEHLDKNLLNIEKNNINFSISTSKAIAKEIVKNTSIDNKDIAFMVDVFSNIDDVRTLDQMEYELTKYNTGNFVKDSDQKESPSPIKFKK